MPKSNVVLIKLFTPVPYMRTPDALLPDKVKRQYALDQTWVLTKSLVHVMQDNGVEVPLGKWVDREGRSTDGETRASVEYVLEVPMDLSEIEAFCSNPDMNIPEGQARYDPRMICVQHAMMLHTLPLAADEITLEPLPEKIDPLDVVVDIGDIADPEAVDVEYERDFVAGHELRGYPVRVPVFGAATIDKQIADPRGVFIYYRVFAKKPMPFPEFVKAMGVVTKPLTFQEWQEKFVPGAGKGSASFPAIDPDLYDILEAGGRVSPADALHKELFDRGCIDMDDNVVCHTFPSDVVEIDKPRKDMAVRLKSGTGEGAGFDGRILKA